MKFKIGDKVRVKKDLKADSFYSMEPHDGKPGNIVLFRNDMNPFLGKIATITEADEDCYFISGSEWGFVDEMFEDGIVPEYELPKFNKGDRVVVQCYRYASVPVSYSGMILGESSVDNVYVIALDIGDVCFALSEHIRSIPKFND